MENFEITSSNMIEIRIKLEEINTNVDEALCKLKTLLSDIETEEMWKGESEITFMLYMDLLKQYQTSFSSSAESCPITQAIDALKDCEKNVESFYSDFNEYKNMENIE